MLTLQISSASEVTTLRRYTNVFIIIIIIVKLLACQGDPLLCDLHTEVTLEEIKSQIALEHGKAITVNVRRADDVVLRK